MTLARDMSIAPFARFTVTIMGSISGVRPTATATANSNASSQSCLVKPLMRKTVGTMTMMNRIINQVKRLMPWSNAVGTRRPAISSASCPKKVCAPVRTTIPVAKPLTTLAPMKHMFGKSNASLISCWYGWQNFSAGMASPVRADWLMNKSLASSKRRSAGIMSPADSLTMSPGTSNSIGTSANSPSPAAGRRFTLVGGLYHCAQAGGRLVGSMLLNESSADCEQHHQHDDDRRAHVADEIGNRRQCQQERIEGISRAAPNLLEDRWFSLARDQVEPEILEPACGSFVGQAHRARLQPLAQRLGRELT